MFSLDFEQRLSYWRDFRCSLEHSRNPIQDTIDLYHSAPMASINCDPWDIATFPRPWELLEENVYCDCCVLLGICYTLALTERFSNSKFELAIFLDETRNKGYGFILFIDDRVIGYTNTHISRTELPQNLQPETTHGLNAIL